MNARPPSTDHCRSQASKPCAPCQRQPAFPVIPHYKPELDLRYRARLESLARAFLREEPGLAGTSAFGERVAAGLTAYPSLVLEDHSWITLYESFGDTSYSYRACLLAGDGDIVVVGIERCPAFEDYCRHTLGLGDFNVISAPADKTNAALSVRCARNQDFVHKIAERARRSGGFNLVPYMGTGGVWLLAGSIARTAKVRVNVAAPPPQLTQRINDKIWFSRSVAMALGPRAQPRTFAAYGLASLLREVSLLSRRDATVVIKLPSSASSTGNVILDSRWLNQLLLRDQRDHLDTALKATGWGGDYPLLVSSWDAPVLASPSVQLWIPRKDEGDPVVEGIFDQALAGPKFEFCGAAPTVLPQALQERLAYEAAALGFLFQSLGYFGRCSLDSVIVGRSESDAQVHWVECNGRWGGTSIPMTLANRLVGDWARVPMAICERGDDQAPAWKFDNFYREMQPHLFKKGGPLSGAIILSPSRIESGTGYELLIFGTDSVDLHKRVQSLTKRFLTRSLSR